MTGQSPTEQLDHDLRGLQDAVRELRSSVRLAQVRDEVEDLQTTVNGLDRCLGALREDGYAFEKELERQAEDLENEWRKLSPGIQRQIEEESSVLKRSLTPLERELSQLDASGDAPERLEPRVRKLQSRVESLEGQVGAAEDAIQGMFDRFRGEVHGLNTHLEKLAWMLSELNEARFQLLATEAGIMATKAVWIRGDKDRPEGVLYLTDRRLLFEQKEKVTTKKVLFIPTEKELVQDLLWEVPVALIAETAFRKEGLLKNKAILELRFEGDAPLNTADLRIWQTGEEWIALIKRAKARDFDASRAIPIDEALAQKVQDAPTKCPSCGGIIHQNILRGMESITCEYCGSVIRL